MMKKIARGFISSLLFLVALLVATPALAHGTTIDVNTDGNQVEVAANFETGEPMAEAQVLVYAPDDPENAWHTGVADTNGRYAFDIDPAQTGEWAVSIRSGGHGQIIYLDVANDGSITTRLGEERHRNQTLLMATAVIAALGAIAYWFSRPKDGEPVTGTTVPQ